MFHITNNVVNIFTDLGFFEPPTSVWIQELSNGGLVQPTNEFFQTIKKLEDDFTAFHRETFSTKKQVVETLTNHLIHKNSSIPKKIIEMFAEARTHFRIHNLNLNIKSSNARNRKKALQYVVG